MDVAEPGSSRCSTSRAPHLAADEWACAELRKVAALTRDPPADQVLKLLFAARRLSEEDRWSSLEVLWHEPLNLWLLLADHFREDFTSCRRQAVVPLDPHDWISAERHTQIAEAFSCKAVFYALVDADGDTILYALEPAALQEPPARRPLCEPAFVPREALVRAAAEQAAETKALAAGASKSLAVAGNAGTGRRQRARQQRGATDAAEAAAAPLPTGDAAAKRRRKAGAD
eukprot:TRINITY_DN58058_c0_g1_i1.p1 TRINITY_DN58058_c0_g1~~TRINITY_DN58058_c0_g1_i1.p1  ORF type:complete len:230 (+),score=55.21 TRINITY_DN58058_c0_g1_i1:2-691(+)